MSISSIGTPEIDPTSDPNSPDFDPILYGNGQDIPERREATHEEVEQHLKEGEVSVEVEATPKDESATVTEDPTEATPTLTVAEPAPQPKDAVLDAILNAIIPIEETRPNLKVLIYSEPGIGKSTLLGQAPNNLIIDAEDGLASLNNHPELLGENVRVIKYKTFDGFEMIIDKIAEQPEELSWIETLSIDTMSELHKKGLAEVTERDWRRSPLNNRYVAETEQHTENNEHIRRLVSKLRDMPVNIIMTAHSRTIEPKNRPSKTFPDFSEKLANTLAGMMDIVAFMDIQEIDGVKKRVLRLHSDGTTTAKTRIGGYPELLVDPTWNQIWEVHQKALLANKK
jgi:phage nucleotide-binding protein